MDTKTPPKCALPPSPRCALAALITACVTPTSGNHVGCNTRRQLAESDDYLFSNHVCLGGKCVAGTLRGSVACLAKRSATVRCDARAAINISGTGCSRLGTGEGGHSRTSNSRVQRNPPTLRLSCSLELAARLFRPACLSTTTATPAPTPLSHRCPGSCLRRAFCAHGASPTREPGDFSAHSSRGGEKRSCDVRVPLWKRCVLKLNPVISTHLPNRLLTSPRRPGVFMGWCLRVLIIRLKGADYKQVCSFRKNRTR